MHRNGKTKNTTVDDLLHAAVIGRIGAGTERARDKSDALDLIEAYLYGIQLALYNARIDESKLYFQRALEKLSEAEMLPSERQKYLGALRGLQPVVFPPHYASR